MPEELLALLLDVPGIPRATSDSIIGVLGLPEIPVQEADLGIGRVGQMNIRDRTITLSPHTPISEEQLAETFAHELTHQQVTAGEREADFQGLMNLFFGKVDSLKPGEKADALEQYGGFGPGFFRDSAIMALAESGEPSEAEILKTRGEIAETLLSSGFEGRAMNEMFAEAIERGFGLARRSTGPGSMSESVAQEDAILPGTREAFNFFMRKFSGG